MNKAQLKIHEIASFIAKGQKQRYFKILHGYFCDHFRKRVLQMDTFLHRTRNSPEKKPPLRSRPESVRVRRKESRRKEGRGIGRDPPGSPDPTTKTTARRQATERYGSRSPYYNWLKRLLKKFHAPF